jgi:hypothetical protein
VQTQVDLWAAVLLFSDNLGHKLSKSGVENGQNAGYFLTFEFSFLRRLDAPDLKCKAGHNKFKLRRSRTFPMAWRLSFSFFMVQDDQLKSTNMNFLTAFLSFFAHFFLKGFVFKLASDRLISCSGKPEKICTVVKFFFVELDYFIYIKI